MSASRAPSILVEDGVLVPRSAGVAAVDTVAVGLRALSASVGAGVTRTLRATVGGGGEDLGGSGLVGPRGGGATVGAGDTPVVLVGVAVGVVRRLGLGAVEASSLGLSSGGASEGLGLGVAGGSGLGGGGAVDSLLALVAPRRGVELTGGADDEALARELLVSLARLSLELDGGEGVQEDQRNDRLLNHIYYLPPPGIYAKILNPF